MDAGERMRFLPQYDFVEAEADDQRLALELYDELTNELWERFSHAIESHGTSTIQILELPLRLDFNDNSYLYLLISRFSGMPSSNSITLEEHAGDGRRLDRLRYGCDPVSGFVIRHETNDSFDEHQPTTHASMIRLLKRTRDALDEDEDTWGVISNAYQNAQLEADMMLNELPVSSEEVFHLGGILSHNDLRVSTDGWQTFTLNSAIVTNEFPLMNCVR